MYYRTALGPHVSRITVAAVQRPRVHLRMLASGGSYPTPNHTESPRPQKGRSYGLYIGVGLGAIGAIWYFYTEKNAPSPAVGSPGGGRPRVTDDATRSVKEHTQEALKSADAKYQEVKAEAESKVQEARDQGGQGVDRLKNEAGKRSLRMEFLGAC